MASPFKHPAAKLPGELDLLAAVTDAPHDDAPKLVYADWLQEHGDPRGEFLRRFVQAVGEGAELPEAGKFPSDWLELTGVSLMQRLVDADLADSRRDVLELAVPAISLGVAVRPESRIDIGASKFCGLPSLPKGSEWPRCGRGPMEFLAQVNLAELQGCVCGQFLPHVGLLSFFVFHDYNQDCWGTENGDHEDGLRVIWTEDTSELTHIEPPEDLTKQLGRHSVAAKMSFAEGLDLPELEEGAYSGLGLPEEFESRDFISDNLGNGNHKLLGYTHYCHIFESSPGPEWTLLAQFYSDRKLQIGWGDGHLLGWFIRPDDLHANKFDDTEALDG